MSPQDLIYIQQKLGFELTGSGLARADDLMGNGFSPDEVVEAITLL